MIPWIFFDASLRVCSGIGGLTEKKLTAMFYTRYDAVSQGLLHQDVAAEPSLTRTAFVRV